MTEIVPLTIEEAEAFLKKHDRHYVEQATKICAIGVGEYKPMLFPESGETKPVLNLNGAAVLGRHADGDAGLAHIYVDGVSQGYSLLYGACWRALKALGYKKAHL